MRLLDSQKEVDIANSLVEIFLKPLALRYFLPISNAVLAPRTVAKMVLEPIMRELMICDSMIALRF